MSLELTFVSDEWKVFDQWRLEPRSLLTPYNEHLSAIPISLLLGLLEILGLRTHLPYLGLLHAMHIVVAVGVFSLVRQTVDAWVALLAAVLVLALGAGWENLFWAWQIGAVTSVAAGVWALLLAQRGGTRAGLAAALLVGVAVASSSFGLPVAVMVGVFGCLEPRSRSVLVPLAVVAVTYAGWLLAFGSDAPGICSATSLADRVATLPMLAVMQVLLGFGALAEWGLVTGVLLAVPALILLVRHPRIGNGSAVAALAGIVALGLLIGVARGCLGPAVGNVSRYLYFSGVLAAIAVAGTLGSWLRSHDTRPARLLTASGVLLAVVGGWLNAAHGRDVFAYESTVVRAALTVGLTRPDCRTPVASDEFTALFGANVIVCGNGAALEPGLTG